MRHKTIYLVPVLVLLVMAIPTAAWATHDVPDERPPTPLQEFREDVGSWIDPWLDISWTTIADDHAPWLAFALYEELLGIKPEPCYWDTYAAYWAVAAGLRALGQAPTAEQQAAEFERVFEDIARADDLADAAAAHCLAAETAGRPGHALPATPSPDAAMPDLDGVVEMHAAATLRFVDEDGDVIPDIAVTPGSTVLIRVDNTAGFEHSLYIGQEDQLLSPGGTTDTGIGPWTSGVRELLWTVPDDVSGLMFGCTVPGHFSVMHGDIVLASPSA